MIIHHLLEAGKPDYNFDDDMAEINANRRTLTEAIQRIGGAIALDQVLNDPSKLIYRGIRGDSATVFTQNTWTTERRAQNTSNYVNLLSEILPSWKAAGVPPRSKAVACSSSTTKSSYYGTLYVVLPTVDAVCTYTRDHDFWTAFDAVNHIYSNDGVHGAIPAINEAFDQLVETGEFKQPTNAQQLVELCNTLQSSIEEGRVKVSELNPEMRAIFEFDPSTNNILDILNVLLDPSHMKVTRGGSLLPPSAKDTLGEEIACSGKLIYIKAELFKEVFGIK